MISDTIAESRGGLSCKLFSGCDLCPEPFHELA